MEGQHIQIGVGVDYKNLGLGRDRYRGPQVKRPTLIPIPISTPVPILNIDPDPDIIGNKKNTLGIRRVCVFAGITVMGSNARLQLQLEAAKKYCESGISVIPIKEGSKFPDRNLLAQAGGSSPRGYASLAPFQKRIPRQMEIQVWFAKEPMNLAIVIGFNDLYALDFEDDNSYWRWVEACPDWAEKLPIQKSATGYHLFFRSANLSSSRYRTFLPAYLLDEPAETRIARLETLGQWVLAWPSLHPDGSLYQWMPGKAPWEIEIPVVYDLSSLNLRIERLKPGVFSFFLRCLTNPRLARSQWGHYRRQRYGEVEG